MAPQDGSDKKTRMGTGAPHSSPPLATPAPSGPVAVPAATPAPVPLATPAPDSQPYSGYTPPPATPLPVAPAPAPALTADLGPNIPAAGMPVAVAPPDPLVGTTLLGRYYVDRKLGEGGMGSVYSAMHVTLEKQVALKVLHSEFSRKEDLVERFLLEAKSASRIRHENVIDISDFGTTPEGSVFFAMEFLEGRDLHEVLARAKLQGQRLEWERSRKIFLQVCAALSAAHGKGIIHRDLKPENIYLVEWLGHKDFVKLLDFGIAKVTEVSDDDEEARKLTRTGMLFGTPEYMSPEQARGEKVDHRVDVYAMGCILFQLVTGSVPFAADNFMGILSLHLTEEPPEVSPQALAVIGAPAELASVIACALAKDREHRFSSIDELANAVRGTEEGVAVAPVIVAEKPVATRKRTQWTGSVAIHDDEAAPSGGGKKVGLIAGAVVAAVVIAGGIFVATSGGGSDSAKNQPLDAAPAAVPASIELALNSAPEGATIIDQKTGEELGTTPFEFTMPGSREPRRVRFALAGYHDKLLEFVPMNNIKYAIELKQRTAGAAPAEPEVEIMPLEPRPTHRPGRKPDPKPDPKDVKPDPKPDPKDVKPDPDPKDVKPDPKPDPKDVKPDPKPDPKDVKPDPKDVKPDPKDVKPDPKPDPKDVKPDPIDDPKIKDPFAPK